jgi:hypothetical protein
MLFGRHAGSNFAQRCRLIVVTDFDWLSQQAYSGQQRGPLYNISHFLCWLAGAPTA